MNFKKRVNKKTLYATHPRPVTVAELAAITGKNVRPQEVGGWRCEHGGGGMESVANLIFFTQ